MARPTIRDVALAAGVSVSTVNRVIHGDGRVRQSTMRLVRNSAASIGFYGVRSIEHNLNAFQPNYRFGMLFLQSTRTFYRLFAQTLENAASRITESSVTLDIRYLDDLSPQNVIAGMASLGSTCDAVGVVAAVHPLVTKAIDDLHKQGVPVFALISQLAATGEVHYVGLDNWKVGRTAAWFITRLCKRPGKIGVLVGNHRYRCQEMNEVGFRSYLREHAPDFQLLEPLSTFESNSIAQEMTERLLSQHPDITGFYVAGGGIRGAITGLRGSGLKENIFAVGYELMDYTRDALLDGTLSVVISHPLTQIATRTVEAMIKSKQSGFEKNNFTTIFPFDLFVRENI